MKVTIINIGSSQGIILPSKLLRQLNLSSKSNVEIEVAQGAIMIKPDPRQGWAEAAMEMHAAGEDQPLIGEEGTSFDQEEWTW